MASVQSISHYGQQRKPFFNDPRPWKKIRKEGVWAEGMGSRNEGDGFLGPPGACWASLAPGKVEGLGHYPAQQEQVCSLAYSTDRGQQDPAHVQSTSDARECQPDAPTPEAIEVGTATTSSAPKIMPARQKPQKKLRLMDWGLPPGVVEAYRKKGVEKMYRWQAAALEEGVRGNNLVYCAPTSGGKSLVAEVLMIRRLLSFMMSERPRHGVLGFKRALIILPYLSVVVEKCADLQAILASTGLQVKGYSDASESGTPLPPGRGEAVAICSIEKANVSINRLAKENRLGELCCVVVDELHMVRDSHRGLPLELALAKLLFSPHAANVQVVGMSATMGGLQTLTTWLKSRLFVTNYRPVKLVEHIVFNGIVYEKGNGQVSEDGMLTETRQLPNSSPRDPDRLLPLVSECVMEGGSVLIFCAGRKQCQACGAMIADSLLDYMEEESWAEEVFTKRKDLVAQMQYTMGTFSSPILERMMLQGVAYHHAGLTSQERELVEQGYRSGALSVLVATSTLAAGVNLPARRLILRSLQQGLRHVSKEQYLQMVGRAGRAGLAERGESFLIGRGAPMSTAGEWQKVTALLAAQVATMKSTLLEPREEQDKAGSSGAALASDPSERIQRMLLESIANGSVALGRDIQRLLSCTLCYHQAERSDLDEAVKEALRLLRERSLLSYSQAAGETSPKWTATRMGQAIYESSLPPKVGESLYRELDGARQNVVLLSSLHMVYMLLAGIEHPFQIANWQQWGRTFRKLPSSRSAVAQQIGIQEMDILKAMRSSKNASNVNARHSRFVAACVVEELLEEKSLKEVEEDWGGEKMFSNAGVSSGQLQKLQNDVAKWAGMAALLCASAGWWQMECLFSGLSGQAAAGARPELLPLMTVQGMDGAKARALYNQGISSPELLASASDDVLKKALLMAVPGRRGRAANKEGEFKAGTHAFVNRSVLALKEAARLHVVRTAEEQEEEAALIVSEPVADGEAASDEDEANNLLAPSPVLKPKVLHSSSLPSGPGHPKFSRPILPRPVQSATGTTGGIKVVQVRETDLSQHASTLAAMCRQDRCTMEVVLAPASSTSPSCPRNAPVQGVAVCWDAREVVYFELGQRQGSDREAGSVWDALSCILQAETLSFIGFDLMDQLIALFSHGLQAPRRVEDLRVAAGLIWPDRGSGMSLKDLQQEVAPSCNVRVHPLSRPAVTAAVKNAVLMWALASPVHALLSTRGMLQVYREVEMPLIPMLASVPRFGPSIDQRAAAHWHKILTSRIGATNAALAKASAFKLDLTSCQSINMALSTLGFPPLSGCSPETGPPTLEQLNAALECALQNRASQGAHLLQLLVEHASLVEQLRALGSLAKYAGERAEGFVAKPNVPHIPWTTEVSISAMPQLRRIDGFPSLRWAGPGGASEAHPEACSLRELLLPSPPHTCLTSIKILHLELSMLAQLSRDTTLLQALQAPDPMGFLASSLIQRRKLPNGQGNLAAGALWAIVQGWQPYQLSQHLGIDRDGARRLLSSTLESLPGVTAFLDTCWGLAQKEGYVRTLSGRMCPVARVKSDDPKVVHKAKRAMCGALCLGSAGDFMKAAALRLCPPNLSTRLSAAEVPSSSSPAIPLDRSESMTVISSNRGSQPLHAAPQGGSSVALMVGSEIVVQESLVHPVELRRRVITCLRGLRVGNQSFDVPIHVLASAGRSLKASDTWQEVICVR